MGRLDGKVDDDLADVPGESGGTNQARNREIGTPVPLADIARLRPFAAELGVAGPE